MLVIIGRKNCVTCHPRSGSCLGLFISRNLRLFNVNVAFVRFASRFRFSTFLFLFFVLCVFLFYTTALKRKKGCGRLEYVTTWTTTTSRPPSKTLPHLRLTTQPKKVECSTTISPSGTPQHLEGLSDRCRPSKRPCTQAGFTLSTNKNYVYLVWDEVDF